MYLLVYFKIYALKLGNTQSIYYCVVSSLEAIEVWRLASYPLPARPVSLTAHCS